MPKSRLNDFSTVASDNTDIAGIGIQGSNSPRNLDDAFRALMAILADWRVDTPLDDTASYNNADDATKTFSFSGEDIPTATARSINIEDLYDLMARGASPTITAYTSSGTHTFADATRMFMLVAVGAGGGSGGVDGAGAGTGGASAGGNSGFYGRTVMLTKGAITTGTVTIGSGGSAGAGTAGNGGNGGNTTWSDGTNSFTWRGGIGSDGVTGTANRAYGIPTGNASSTVTLIGTYSPGFVGATNATNVCGGTGGSSPWGTGGIASAIAFETAVDASTGSGYGAGASGAASHGISTNAAGAPGMNGRLEVWEF